MTGTIAVAGDVHLGSEHADRDAFTSFLEGLYQDRDRVSQLVLLGDIWDMIRRDPFGCAWETSETITAVKKLATELPVHVVFGNHDTHLRHLDVSRYDVEFHDDLVLESGDKTIRFCHGESFDRLQSNTLSNHLSGPGDRGDIDPTRGLKDPVVSKGRDIVQTGKRRFRALQAALRNGEAPAADTYPRRERRAHEYLEQIPEDKLVFGHTHTPYVRPDNAVANPGSWKATAPVSNTYILVDDGDISLYRHRKTGGDEAIGSARRSGPLDE